MGAPDELPGPMTKQQGRFLAWIAGTLALLALGVGGVLWFFVWPAATLREAEEALRHHDPLAAHAHLDRSVARWPNDPRALFLAAQAARRCDACPDAERYLTACEQASPPTDDSRLEWALLGVQQGDFGDQEAGLLSSISRDHPQAAAMAEALAKGYYAAFRLPEAIGVLDSLIGALRDHVPALVLRSTILGRVRKWDKALADGRRAVELAPESGTAHIALARALSELGHTREAVYHYELALHYRPNDRIALLGLARVLADDGELVEAERPLDALLAAEPQNTDGLVERARLALRRRRAGEAEPLLAQAIDAAPWHRDAQQLSLVMFKELGRTREIAQTEARLAELKGEDGIGGCLRLRARDSPGDIAARWDLWLWCQKNGQREEGFGWLVNLLRVDPKHAGAHAAIADHFERAGQPRRAALHRSPAIGLRAK